MRKNKPVYLAELKIGVPQKGGPNALKILLSLYDLVELEKNLPTPIPLHKEVPPDKMLEFYLSPEDARKYGKELLDKSDLLSI